MARRGATNDDGRHRRAATAAVPFVLALALVLVGALPASALLTPDVPASGPRDGRVDRVVVRLTDPDQAHVVAGRVRGSVARRIGTGTAVLELPDGAAPAAVAALARDRRVAWAEPDAVLRAAIVPDDPCYTRCSDQDQWNLRAVNAEGAWDVSRGSPSVVVAVLDTGVDAAHPDLAGKVIVGSNLSSSPDSVDRTGHGTHVTGIVAAVTGNATGVAGMGWQTRVRAIKVLGDDGSGFASDIARGMDEAVQTGARVINLSLAGERTTVLHEAVQRARVAGVVVVAAAGNEGQTEPHWPAAEEGVIGVTSIGRTSRVSAFANNGPWVDMAAPGEGVISTVPGGYGLQSGTSMSAPLVAATAALMAAANQGITGSQIESLIASTAAPIEGAGTVVKHGRLDAARALAAAVGIPANPGPGSGYRLVASDGGIFNFGAMSFHGSTGGIALNSPIVGMANTPTRRGYWLVAADGGIFAFGDARFFGSTGGFGLREPIVGIAPTPSGGGYWLASRDGTVFAFGDALFLGSTPTLNRPIVGLARTPTGGGYWLVASDGGIFAFGSAPFYGSTGSLTLNQPIVGMAAPTPAGYWLVASDGGIFAFGDAPFYGSTGSIRLNMPIVGIGA